MRILGASTHPDEWDAVIGSLPEPLQDVHFTSAYGRVQEADNTGRAILAVMDGFDGTVVAQPFLMQRIEGTEYFDLKNLYGFGGPISNVPSYFVQSYGRSFREELRQWACSANVVSEFCVLHPLLPSYQLPLIGGDSVLWTKQVVVVYLESFTLETCSRRVKRAIKKAGRFMVTENTNPFAFHVFYTQSMDRLKAAGRWRHDVAYWLAHKHEDVGAKWYFVPGHRALLVVSKGKTAYAHFLGSDGELPRAGLDEFLYFHVAEDLARQGFERFHLGGGLTWREDDSLLAFKSGFAQPSYTVGTYRRVFMPDVYDKLVTAVADGRSTNWFPAYRAA